MKHNTLVFMNGELVGHIDGHSLKECKKWIKEHLFSTHMGEWQKTKIGWNYGTTIGRYYEFKRESALKPREAT